MAKKEWQLQKKYASKRDFESRNQNGQGYFGNRPDFVRRQNRRTKRKRINWILRKVIEKMFEKGEKGLKI
jgi:hypothetical protein